MGIDLSFLFSIVWLLITAHGVVVWFKEREDHTKIGYKYFGIIVLIIGGPIAYFVMERDKDPEFMCLSCWIRRAKNSLLGVL